MPRLAAFSLGLLMFTTSTLVSEGRVEGKKLLSKFEAQDWDLCRATDMDPDQADAMWFSRLLRRPPSVTEHQNAFDCFNIETHGFLGWGPNELKGTLFARMLKATPHPFNKSALQTFLADQNASGISEKDALSHGVEKPSNNKVGALSHSFGFPMDDIVPWLEYFSGGALQDANFTEYGFHCMYQCTKWKSVGLMAVIKNVGTIVAGSAVVVKTSDSISKNFGGRFFSFLPGGGFMLGLPLVNQDTDSKMIQAIIESTRTPPGKGRSKIWAAMVCIFAATPLRFASKLNVDGYFTVDYYVTAVFCSSLIMACVVRQFQPYKVMRIAYTEEMWANGKDTFLDMETHEFKELDMYEWIHLTQIARANHLLGYARKVSPKDIKVELDLQKTRRKGLSTKDSEKGLAAAKPEMKTEYYNEHANLVVKVIREISVSSISPPLSEPKGDKLPQGGVISKVVVVRPNAIGTVVAKVDNDRIKIRIAKELPTNPPLLKSHLPIVVYPEEKKALLCYDDADASGTKLPVSLIDETQKFDPNGKNAEDIFHGVLPNLRQEFHDAFAKDNWVHERQYIMAMNPKPGEDLKHDVNAWFHNEALRLLKPQSRRAKSDQKEDPESKPKDEATKWEDVVVSLQEVMEASEDWKRVEKERDEWIRTHGVRESEIEDNPDQK